jgi:hypothetical protein
MTVIVLMLMWIETGTTQPIAASEITHVKQMIGNDV